MFQYPEIPHETLGRLVREALAGYPVGRVWLFGSRAKGTHRPDSDYDILVELKGEWDWRQRASMAGEVSRTLYDRYRVASSDVLVIDDSNLARAAQNRLDIISTAQLEGTLL